MKPFWILNFRSVAFTKFFLFIIFTITPPVKRSVDRLKATGSAIDRLALRKIVFTVPSTDPIRFFRSFEKCFHQSVGEREKVLNLEPFIPQGFRSQFDDVLAGDPNGMYAKLHDRFIDLFLEDYLALKSAKLSIKFEDYSSILKFIDEKSSAYCNFEHLDQKDAYEKAFYSLPLSLIREYTQEKGLPEKNSLRDFCKFKDIQISAQYRQLVSQTNSLRCGTDQPISPPQNNRISPQNESSDFPIFHPIIRHSQTPLLNSTFSSSGEPTASDQSGESLSVLMNSQQSEQQSLQLLVENEVARQ